MTRGTTPELRFRLPFAAKDLKRWRISFAQRGIEKFAVEDTAGTAEGQELRLRLKQEESLALEAGVDVDIQLRALQADGTAIASRILRLPVEESLNEEVLA